MNIKQIIQEEIDSFEWASDIPDMDNYNNVYFTRKPYNGVRYHIVDRGGDNITHFFIYDDEGNSLYTSNKGFSRVWPRGLVDRMFDSDSFIVTS